MSALLPNAFSEFECVKPLRPIDRVFVHCSASDYPQHDNVATMRQWHLERGWSDVGYHFFIRKDGTLEIINEIDSVYFKGIYSFERTTSTNNNWNGE